MSDEKGSLINIELIPKELITNVFGPATKSIGEGLGGVANFVMGPLRKLNVVSEKSYQDFVEKVNCKTDSIPEENRDISKLGLTLKVMEDSRYQLEDEDMREYFSNLIAGLIDNRKNEIASPRFSSILLNLTTSEAKLLNKLHQLNSPCPSVTLRFQRKDNGDGADLVRDILLFENQFFDSKITLDSLESYGLIEINSFELRSEHKMKLYSDFEESEYFKNFKSETLARYQNDDFFAGQEPEVLIKKGGVLITSFGKAFCSLIFG